MKYILLIRQGMEEIQPPQNLERVFFCWMGRAVRNPLNLA